ncbi:hypothetical protein ABZ667_40135 [Streptomyces lavendulae]|uniref:COG1470 family protein n=1 Tax=Streptomyces lavendulae TaxID=1914 RepID=UPI0033E91977
MSVRAELTLPDEPVPPGGSLTAHLRVWNESRIVDAYDLQLIGPPASWPDAEPALGRLPLFPGNHEKINIPVKLPRDKELASGKLVFAVRVASVENPASIAVPEAAITVGEFREIEVEPVRARTGAALWGGNLILLHNVGNAAATVRLRVAPDDAEAPLRVRLRRTRLTLHPGERARISLTVQVRNPLMTGTPAQWRIRVRAVWDSGQERSATFVHHQRPLVPKPALKVLITLTAASMAASVLWLSPVGGTQPEAKTESAKGPSQVEAAEQAEKDAAKKKQEEKEQRDAVAAGALQKSRLNTSLVVTSKNGKVRDKYTVKKGYRLVVKTIQITASGPATGTLLLHAGSQQLASMGVAGAKDFTPTVPVSLDENEKLALSLDCPASSADGPPVSPPAAPTASAAACTATAVVSGELLPLKGPFAEP